MKACEIGGWDDAVNIVVLAAAYATQGNFKRAIEWQELLLRRCRIWTRKRLPRPQGQPGSDIKRESPCVDALSPEVINRPGCELSLDHWVIVAKTNPKIVEAEKRIDFRLEAGDSLMVLKSQDKMIDFGPGWISRDDVVPYDKAFEYFSKKIEENPTLDNFLDRAATYMSYGGKQIAAAADIDAALQANRSALRASPLSPGKTQSKKGRIR